MYPGGDCKKCVLVVNKQPKRKKLIRAMSVTKITSKPRA